MVSLFSLYKTKWQKLPRFLGQKCFLGALKGTQKKHLQDGTKSSGEHHKQMCCSLKYCNTSATLCNRNSIVKICVVLKTLYWSVQRAGVSLPEVCLTSIQQKVAKGDRTMLLRNRYWRIAGQFQLSEMRVRRMHTGLSGGWYLMAMTLHNVCIFFCLVQWKATNSKSRWIARHSARLCRRLDHAHVAYLTCFHAECFIGDMQEIVSVIMEFHKVSCQWLTSCLTFSTNLPEPSSLQHGKPRWTYIHPSLQSLSPDQETEFWWLCGPASAFLLSHLSPADFSKKYTGLKQNSEVTDHILH